MRISENIRYDATEKSIEAADNVMDNGHDRRPDIQSGNGKFSVPYCWETLSLTQQTFFTKV